MGREAAEESEEIKRILSKYKIAFITAGMGGGTGTGEIAPIIAKFVKTLIILTVGVEQLAFLYERVKEKRASPGRKWNQQIKDHVDTLLVIVTIKCGISWKPHNESSRKTDNVLATCAKCITDVVVRGRMKC